MLIGLRLKNKNDIIFEEILGEMVVPTGLEPVTTTLSR